MMFKISRKASLPLAAALSFSVAFAGLPLANIPLFLRMQAAFAAGSDSIVTIAGLGTKRTLKLGLNKALVVDLPADAHDILVSDPKMADAVTRTSRRIYLFGKTVGQTNIFIFGADGKEIVSLDLQIERDIAGLQGNIKRFIPDSDISVEIISDNIVLTGMVRTPQDSIRAQQLAQAFLKGGEATTRTETASGTGGDSSVALFAEGRQSSQIVNMLQIEGEDQVTLKVTVAEIKRSVLKQIGFDNLVSNSSGLGVAQFGSIGNTGTTNFLGVNGDPSNATGAGGLSGLFKYALGKYNISSYLNALEQAGAVRTLAEPTLTAISGQAATFNSGGQTLYSTTDKDGNTTITPYTYGITLAFTPLFLPAAVSVCMCRPRSLNRSHHRQPRLITSAPPIPRLSCRPEVRSPLPAFLSDNVQQTTSGTPGASKIPLLGALFRQKSFQRDESELVIIATPYLVRPVARDKLARPDDNFSPSNDAGVFFMNRVNKIYGRKDAPPVADADFHGTVGFIYK